MRALKEISCSLLFNNVIYSQVYHWTNSKISSFFKLPFSKNAF